MSTNQQIIQRAVAAAVRAADGWHDPSDALSFVDVADYIDDEGKIDLGGIRDAVGKVGRSKPHLLTAPPRTRPTADGGGREGPTKTVDVEKALAAIKRDTGIS